MTRSQTIQTHFKERHRLWLAGFAVVFVVGVIVVFFRWGIDLQEVQAWMSGLHGGLVLLLMSLLPLVGFPVSILYVVAGARHRT